jgi:predicted nucleic acid-binding protein
MRLLLDTTFVIDHLRGLPAAVDRFAQLIEDGHDVYVNEIVACETRSGLRDRDAAVLDAFLRPIEFVQPGPDVAVRAGSWRASARARGWQLSLPDALIAATADALDAAVLTRNLRDFAVTPVRVETY